MAGKIYVLQEGDKLTELTSAMYTDEDFFQGLIERHPEILAGDQINPDNPRKWLLVSREMGVPEEQDGGTRWFLDHLFIDQDAIPTFVEVKRSTDTRIRREVVAQMLDYAANAVEYWPIELIRDAYEKNMSATNSLSAIGRNDEEAYWQAVNTNLRAGRIRMIFAADMIPASLQRIIEFLNVQMVDTEVLGLEIKQYTSTEGLTTLVPHIIGRTASAISTKGERPKKWDEESFLEQTAKVSGDTAVKICKKILATFSNCRVWWGEGQKSGGYTLMYDKTESHWILSVTTHEKSTNVMLWFKDMKPPFNTAEYRSKIKKGLERISGIHIPEEKFEKYPTFNILALEKEANYDIFVETLTEYIKDIDALDKNEVISK